FTSLSPADKRDEANRTLRRILDNTDGRNGVLVVLATTRRFVDDPTRGARSYPALWQRLREVAPSRGFNPRSTILHLPDFKRADFGSLAERIAELHGIAYGWVPSGEALSDHVTAVVRGIFGAAME